MSSKRPPFWFSTTQMQELSALVMHELENGNRQIATSIHEELAVARPRFKNGLFTGHLLATVLGMDRESVPVRLSDQEHAYLLSLPLSDNLRGGLER